MVVQSSATRLRHHPAKGSRSASASSATCARKRIRFSRSLRLPSFRTEAVEILQIGSLLDPKLKPATRDPRYRWLGGVPHARALKWLASSHAMVISSRMEGGANVVCEAIRIGVPVLASHISGNIGLLGERYAGYFPVGDARALARLISLAAKDQALYRTLKKQIAKLRPMVAPRSEARALLAAIRA